MFHEKIPKSTLKKSNPKDWKIPRHKNQNCQGCYRDRETPKGTLPGKRQTIPAMIFPLHISIYYLLMLRFYPWSLTPCPISPRTVFPERAQSKKDLLPGCDNSYKSFCNTGNGQMYSGLYAVLVISVKRKYPCRLSKAKQRGVKSNVLATERQVEKLLFENHEIKLS